MPSVYVFIFPVLVIAYMIWSRMKLKTSIAANSDKNIAPIMGRMGLTLVEGDGNLNLLYFQAQQPRGDFSRKIVAKGQPYGRPVTFTLIDAKDTTELIVQRRITTRFGCYLEVVTQANLPPFELSLRNPNQYLVPQLDFAERPELREAYTGNQHIDATFLIRAADPRMAPVLGPALQVLATQLYVHMLGEGNRIWMSFERIGLNYLSTAPEEMLLALEGVACALEGRPLPAGLGAQPPPMARPA